MKIDNIFYRCLNDNWYIVIQTSFCITCMIIFEIGLFSKQFRIDFNICNIIGFCLNISFRDSFDISFTLLGYNITIDLCKKYI